MKAGRIELYSWDGKMIRSYRYDSFWHRGEVLKKWRMYYGNNMDKCYIQIIPVVEDLEIDLDGTNLSKHTELYKSRKKQAQQFKKAS